MSTSLVIIPTYNEKDNISAIIQAVMEQPRPFELLIIDDGSPDGTAGIVKTLISNQTYGQRLHLLERSGKLGLGTAYITGFKWALQRNIYDCIIEMDADFSHNPADLPHLYDACMVPNDKNKKTADVAIGSRYIKGGGVKNWPTNRVLMSKYASYYVRAVTWMPVHDTTAGFVCYRAHVLKAIELDKIRFIGYAFQIEMKFAAWQLGFKLTEVPIIFADRVYGESKMSTKIFSEAFLGVLKMRWLGFFKSYRSK